VRHWNRVQVRAAPVPVRTAKPDILPLDMSGWARWAIGAHCHILNLSPCGCCGRNSRMGWVAHIARFPHADNLSQLTQSIRTLHMPPPSSTIPLPLPKRAIAVATALVQLLPLHLRTINATLLRHHLPASFSPSQSLQQLPSSSSHTHSTSPTHHP
jgi:hypothetical protein